MLPNQIPNSAVVKSTVKASLKDKFVSATVAANSPIFAFLALSLICGLGATLFTGVAAIVSELVLLLFVLFLVSPLTLGTVRYFWRLGSVENEPPSAVFYYFSSFKIYKRAIKCTFTLASRLFFTFFLSLLPYFIVSLLSKSWLYQILQTEMPIWVAGLVILESFLRIAGFLIALVISLRYYLVFPLVAMDDNMLLLEAVHLSVSVSRRSSGAFIALVLSLIWHILLSLFLLPTLATAPTIFGAFALHSRYAIVNYNQNIEYNKKQFKEIL